MVKEAGPAAGDTSAVQEFLRDAGHRGTARGARHCHRRAQRARSHRQVARRRSPARARPSSARRAASSSGSPSSALCWRAAWRIAYWLARGDWLHGLLAGLTLAMAILPEELPVVLTLFLGLGAWRLAREKVLARSIPAVELLGATTVLCVDKTGTLTANRMAVRRLWSEAAVHDSLAGRRSLHCRRRCMACWSSPCWPATAVPSIRWRQPSARAGQRLLADTEHLHADWALIDDYPLSSEMLAMSRVWQSPRPARANDRRQGRARGHRRSVPPRRRAPRTDRRPVSAMARDGLRVLGVARATFDAQTSCQATSMTSTSSSSG